MHEARDGAGDGLDGGVGTRQWAWCCYLANTGGMLEVNRTSSNEVCEVDSSFPSKVIFFLCIC